MAPLLRDDAPPCGQCSSICMESPAPSVQERLDRIPWDSLKRLAERKEQAGVDPDDYPDTYLTNWYRLDAGATCLGKNLEGTLNLIILLVMRRIGNTDQDDIKEWIDGQVEEHNEGTPPSVIAETRSESGNETSQALSGALAYWIEAAALSQHLGDDRIAWPSLMQAQLHLGRACGPATMKEVSARGGASKELTVLREAIREALHGFHDKQFPTLPAAIASVILHEKVRSVQANDTEKSTSIVDFTYKLQRNNKAYADEFVRVAEKTGAGRTTKALLNREAEILNELQAYDTHIHAQLLKHSKKK